MSKTWLLKLLPGLLLCLLAGTALAGGVVVTLDETLTDVSAGTPFEVNFTIRSAHDGSLQDEFHPIILATDPSTGEVLRFQATAREEVGRYTASVTLPTAGDWAWRIVPEASYPEQLVAEMTPIQVLAPSAPAAPVAQTAPSAVPGASWGLAALISALAVGLVVVGLRRRLAPAA